VAGTINIFTIVNGDHKRRHNLERHSTSVIDDSSYLRSVGYDHNTFILHATVTMIVNYDLNTFIVQATGANTINRIFSSIDAPDHY